MPTPTRIEQVNRKNLQAAVTAALDGPERKELKICRHEFNVKPVTLTHEGDYVIVDGTKGHHISHEITMAPDDQVYYKLRVRKGGVTRDDVKFELHDIQKWGPWLEHVYVTLEKHKEILIALGGLVFKADGGDDRLLQALLPILDDEKQSWRAECSFLMTYIGLAAAQRSA